LRRGCGGIRTPDVFPLLWEELEARSATKEVVATEEVLAELERRDDDLCKWARRQDSMFTDRDRR
jgi:hypothetical protein